ncbi:hypothetical protein MAR_003156, partial [Mya arenaria]
MYVATLDHGHALFYIQHTITIILNNSDTSKPIFVP